MKKILDFYYKDDIIFLCKNTGFSAFVFFCEVGFVSQQSNRVFFVRGFGCALFILWGNLQMSFSENFKEARKNSGLTQQQLADMLEMDRSSVSKYENGIGLPLANALQKICEILGVTMDSLFK